MRLYRRGDVWHVSYFDAEGKRRRESTKCTDRRAAEDYGRQREREATAPDSAAKNKETVEMAMQRLLDHRHDKALLGEGSDRTVSFYAQKAGHWLRILGADYKLSKITAAIVDDYISKRRHEGAKQTTVAKELVCLRAALKLAIRAGTYDGNPMAVLPIGYSPGYKPRERWLTTAEVQLLISQLVPDRAARVAFIVATGAESGAADRAERSDAEGDLVLVRGTKRPTRWRKVPIVTNEQRELLAYALKHAEGEGGLLFRPWSTGSIIRDIKGACRRAGIEPCTPNDLRRTAATWLAHQGVGDELIGKFLGHTSPAMARLVYAKLGPIALGDRIKASIGCVTGVSEVSVSNAVIGKDGTDLEQKTDGTSEISRARQDLNLRHSDSKSSRLWPKPSSVGRNRHAKKTTVSSVWPRSPKKGGTR